MTLAERLAAENKLPEHRDDALHMIVKNGDKLDSEGVRRWRKFLHDPKNSPCLNALRKCSDDHPDWTASQVTAEVRKKNGPYRKDALGFRLPQNLTPYVARWLPYDDPKRRPRFQFGLIGKQRKRNAPHCDTCTCGGAGLASRL